MKKAFFKMGVVFPSEDPLARWIVGLSVISNDLVLANINLLKAREDSKQSGSTEWIYYFRLVCSHYREATTYLDRAHHPQVCEFISSLPSGIKEKYEIIRSSFTPWEASFVESIVRPIRNRFFHYPNSESNELKRGLYELRDEKVFFLSGGDIGNSRASFADTVGAWMMFDGKLNDTHYIKNVLIKLRNLVAELILFTKEATAAYMHTVKEKKPDCFEVE